MRKLPLLVSIFTALTILMYATFPVSTVYGDPSATPTATPTSSPSVTASPTALPSPTPTPTLAPTPSPTPIPLTMIRGNVNKVIPGPKLVGLPSQPVTVMCGANVKNVMTNASGLYTATFTPAECPLISPVTSRSSYNGSVMLRQVWTSGQGNATIDLNF